jgi:hypothetical protein
MTGAGGVVVGWILTVIMVCTGAYVAFVVLLRPSGWTSVRSADLDVADR